MPPWSVVLLIPVACFLPGWLAVRQFAPGKLSLPLAFAALTLGLSFVGWLALALAEFSLYTIGGLALAWLLLTAALLALELWRGRTGQRPAAVPRDIGAAPPLFSRWPKWAEALILILWLTAAVWLFFRPHEYILGAADAGVYVSLGSSIATRGSIVFQDDALAGLNPTLYPSLLRPLSETPTAPYYLLPGFYVANRPPGEITPQFYPLYPTWLAVAFSLVTETGAAFPAANPAGIRAMLLMNGLWAVLGSLAVYLLVRQFMGWEVAALALLALSLTALQVWFARYPTTEMLTQFALWSGLYALSLWLGGERPGGLWAFVAGVALGIVFLVRVDILVLLPVLGLLALWLITSGRGAGLEARAIGWFLAPLSALVAHSFVHAWLQSRPYFIVHTGLGLRLLQANRLIPLVAAAAAVAFLWLLWRAGPRFMSGFGRYRRYALLALMAATLVFAAYGWFVRPIVGQLEMRADLFSDGTVPLTDHENWRRLGWYLSPAGIWLGVAGTCVLIWKLNRRTALFLAVGALFAALYLWRLQANPHQVYAMRRFVPAVVPFFTLAAAALIGWLAGLRPQWAKFAAATMAALWLGGLAWSAQGFISQVDHAGLTAQVHRLNDSLAPGSVLLFNDGVVIGNGDFFGTPLKFIYGHDVFVMRDPAQPPADDLVQQLRTWYNNGQAIYWIGDPAWLDEQGLDYQEETHSLHSLSLESTYERKPSAIRPSEWILRVAQITPAP